MLSYFKGHLVKAILRQSEFSLVMISASDWLSFDLLFYKEMTLSLPLFSSVKSASLRCE